MADFFIGEIRVFPYEYAPEGWALCNGQELSVSQFQALFAVIGTRYGGDGRSTFKLPNLMVDAATGRGAAPVGAGTGPGLTPRALGPNSYGAVTATLSLAEIPAHAHNFEVVYLTDPNNTLANPANARLARGTVNNPTPTPDQPLALFAPPNAAAKVAFREPATSVVGGGQVHENRQPALSMNFYIALDGDFPVRP
ncbi:tail fiber protein [Sphingomonas sp. AOB5]|uniref:phage tail protein n=1 Tax=Sphingomonas sp. AOB5 TaxID=3034017 RepID=UPI0023FA42A4|nr:tail fiber protein [Sphingomonas sp. AOB5]MDF7777495.1 tail fiber protein [Sphingomonas sp. AOB5]